MLILGLLNSVDMLKDVKYSTVLFSNNFRIILGHLNYYGVLKRGT